MTFFFFSWLDWSMTPVLDPEISVRRKVGFLLRTLVLEDEETESVAVDHERIHVNSHAAQLQDRSRSDTRGMTLAAFAKYGIVVSED